MKVTKNTTKESLRAYLGRILPAKGFKVIRRSSEYGPAEYYVVKNKYALIPNKVAEIESRLITLWDNNFLKILTDVLPAWEQMTTENVEVRLAKEIVRA